MQMIRQDYDRIDHERPGRMRNTERMAQVVDMILNSDLRRSTMATVKQQVPAGTLARR
jgi:hypothetical protein